MRINNGLKVWIAIISLVLCLFLIKETYGKYLSSANSQASMAIAKWQFLVNNQDIRDSNISSSLITPIFPGNSNLAANVLAPRATGYFDVIINSSNVDVSFTYSITTNVNANSNVTDLVTTGYAINGTTTNFDTYNTPITGTILRSDNINTTSIRVFVLWDDTSATATMDNVADTATTLSGQALLDVTLSFTQYADT